MDAYSNWVLLVSSAGASGRSMALPGGGALALNRGFLVPTMNHETYDVCFSIAYLKRR
jgi:hypothetical protein